VNAINIRETILPVNTGTEVEVLKGNLDRIEAHAHKHGIPVLAHLNHPNYGVPVTAEGGERIFEVYPWHATGEIPGSTLSPPIGCGT
jgi:hypothetical protein